MTDQELMHALDELEVLANDTPTTHVRAGKALVNNKEVVALWFDDCTNPIKQAIYINATKPEKIKALLKPLRARLARPNDFNPDWDAMAVMVEEQQRMAKRIEEFEARLALDVHCPVCGFYCLGKGGVYCIDKPTLTQQNSSSNISSSSAPEREPEPVAIVQQEAYGRGQVFWVQPASTFQDGTPLYTAPPRREWVGLTEKDIVGCFDLMPPKFARAVEAKLKEKNT